MWGGGGRGRRSAETKDQLGEEEKQERRRGGGEGSGSSSSDEECAWVDALTEVLTTKKKIERQSRQKERISIEDGSSSSSSGRIPQHSGEGLKTDVFSTPEKKDGLHGGGARELAGEREHPNDSTKRNEGQGEGSESNLHAGLQRRGLSSTSLSSPCRLSSSQMGSTLHRGRAEDQSVAKKIPVIEEIRVFIPPRPDVERSWTCVTCVTASA